MDEKKTILLVVLGLLILTLGILAFTGTDHDLRSTVIALIVGVVGALTGLSINLKGLASQVEASSKTTSPDLTPQVKEINQRLQDVELWTGKVHELLVKKNRKGEDIATPTGLKIGQSLGKVK